MQLLTLTLALVGTATLVTAMPQENWDYGSEKGPEQWGKLSPEYSTCATGQQQSPIDIRKGAVNRYTQGERGAPQLELKWAKLPQVVGKHNSHTVQVDVPEADSAQQQVIYQNTTYNMLQFHLHTPSEHRVEGKYYDGEIHFVHKSQAGNLLVIGAFLDAENGPKDGEVFKPLLDNPPMASGNQTEPFTMDLIRVKRLIGGPSGFWNYNGSLTTPPCTEGVTWIMLDTHLKISLQQLDATKKAMGFNARHIK